MKQGSKKWMTGALLAAVAATTGWAVAQDQPTMTQQQMAEEIRQLKARLAQVEARANQPSAAEVDAVVKRVEEDAEYRSRIGSDFSINYTDGKLLIANADKSFVFHPWAQLQFRHATSWRDTGGLGGSDNTQDGFEFRRVRLGIDGTAFTDFTYLVAISAQRNNTTISTKDTHGATNGSAIEQYGGTVILDETWGMYHFHDTPWYVRAGQFHDPLAHEPSISSKTRGMEVSATTDVFGNTDTFVQGASLVYDPKNDFRAELAVTDGIRSANLNFQDYPVNNISYDFGVAGRVEYKAFGNWADYGQLTSLNNKKDLLVFGLGNDFSEAGDTNSWTHTIDVQYAQPNGLFLYGAAWGRYTENNIGIPNGGPVGTSFGKPGHSGVDTYEYAFEGYASYLIAKRWEPFVRGEYMWLQGTPAGSNDGVQIYSAGFNYYVFGHNAFFTTKAMYLPQGIPVNDDGNDILISNNKSEFVVAEQFQLVL